MTQQMQSVNNQSFIPLGSGNVFIGKYDNVVSRTTACISFVADSEVQLIAYTSQNKIQEYPVLAQFISAGQHYNYNLTLTDPYLYFTIRNTGTAQTYLRFTVIYKDTFYNDTDPKGNAIMWNNSTVLAGGLSSAVYTDESSSVLSIFGRSSGATTLTLKMGLNSGNMYASQYSVFCNGGDFGFSIPMAFYCIQLESSNSATSISATAVWS